MIHLRSFNFRTSDSLRFSVFPVLLNGFDASPDLIVSGVSTLTIISCPFVTNCRKEEGSQNRYWNREKEERERDRERDRGRERERERESGNITGFIISNHYVAYFMICNHDQGS